MSFKGTLNKVANRVIKRCCDCSRVLKKSEVSSYATFSYPYMRCDTCAEWNERLSSAEEEAASYKQRALKLEELIFNYCDAFHEGKKKKIEASRKELFEAVLSDNRLTKSRP